MTPPTLLSLLLVAYQPPTEEEVAVVAPTPEPEAGVPTQPEGEAEGEEPGDVEPEGPASTPVDSVPEPGPEPTESETVTAGDGGEPPPEELDMDDIFGTTEELELEELPAAGSATPSGPASKKRFAGQLKTRFRIVSSAYFDIDDFGAEKRWEQDYADRGRISRQENRLEFYFNYEPNRHIQVVGDIEPVFMGVSEAGTLGDLSSRRMLTPFHVESDAAYIAVLDALPGLDVKIGRQVLVWGTADKFNPTNNLNPDDLEDRPLFTEPIANQMIVADFAPLQDRLWFQAVYIPLFFPALLPPSAGAALEDPEATPPIVRQSDVDKVREAQRFMNANVCFTTRVISHVEQPQADIENGQVGAKIGSRVGQFDFSTSYFYGRHDIPLPHEANATRVADCDPMMPPEDGIYFESDAYLRYPRMHVLGLDFAGQIPFMGNLGVWGEAGVFFPTQSHEMRIELPIPLDVTPDDGIANAVTEIQGPTVYGVPWLKATAGLDYTFGKHVYVNAQYVRGFINEFGAGNMGNYAVAGTDLIFFGRHLIFRLFGVVEFPSNGWERHESGDRSGHITGLGKPTGDYAAALAPDIIVVPPWGYVTFELGGFALLGGKETTLAQRGAGSSIVYFKVAGQF